MRLDLKTATILAVCLPLACQAATDCTQAQTQSDMNACAGDGFAQADARLNTLYHQLAKRLAPDDLERLRAAERAWIAYRDSHCAFVGGPSEDGSIHAMIVGTCMADLTAARADEIQRHLDCPEGDLSCVR